MSYESLSLAFPGKVHFPGSQAYASSKTSYFAAFENEVSPACFLQPETAQEVSEIVKYIRSSLNDGETKVAIRSGGHTAWAGSANVENGLTIDLSKLNGIVLDGKKEVASIGVGCKWGDVYKKLSEDGLAIVGGRVSKVGVGGLTLGGMLYKTQTRISSDEILGGISYFSAERGFVCDSVINYEVVLASGELLSVNKDSYPDLFIGLKGGSGNFGVVTRIDFPTFQLGKMWGGALYYANSAYPALVTAFSNFAKDTAPDEKAALIVATGWIPGQGELCISNLYHGTPALEAPPSLKSFLDIQPQLASTLRSDTLLGLADEQAAFSTNGQRCWFFTTGFRVDTQLMIDIRTLWLSTMETLKNQPDMVVSLVFQPITKGMIENSLKRGDNSLGLSVSDGPLVVCLLNTVHSNSTSDDIVSVEILKLLEKIDSLATERGLASRYKFLNYGYKGQKILEGYGKESTARLKSVSKKYDPTGLFQSVVPGGFKVSLVDI